MKTVFLINLPEEERAGLTKPPITKVSKQGQALFQKKLALLELFGDVCEDEYLISRVRVDLPREMWPVQSLLTSRYLGCLSTFDNLVALSTALLRQTISI